MHSDLKITDGVYRVPSGIDVRKRIGHSGNAKPGGPHEAALPSRSKGLLKWSAEGG